MAEVWSAKELVAGIKAAIAAETAKLAENGIVPTLGIVRVGNRPDDVSYERGIIRNSESVGIRTVVFETAADIAMADFVTLLERINQDRTIHGILMFRPLPKQLDYGVIKHLINPIKDVDCCNPLNLAKVFEGERDVLYPTTPEAVVEILKHFQEPLAGSRVAIVNRSVVVGRPLAMMLLNENATVTLCHSKTRALSEVTAAADIVVTAVARANFFGPEYFSEKSAVVDVGINLDADGKLCGDVDFKPACELVRAITPVPGGVGTVTTALLLRHVLQACQKQNG